MQSRDGQVTKIARDNIVGNWQMVSDSLVIDSGTSIITFPTNDVLALLRMLAMNGLNCRYDSVKFN